MPDGLLHIGSMAVLAGTAYLGLEKVGTTKNAVVAGLNALAKKLNDEITLFDTPLTMLVDTTHVVRPIFDNHESHLLFELADRDCANYKKKMGYGWFKFRHAPMLTYLRSGFHNLPVGFLTILSFVGFFWLVGCSINDAHLLVINSRDDSADFSWFLFFVFALTLVIILVNALAAHRIDTLNDRCMPMLRRLIATMQAERRDAEERQGKKFDEAVAKAGENVVK